MVTQMITNLERLPIGQLLNEHPSFLGILICKPHNTLMQLNREKLKQTNDQALLGPTITILVLNYLKPRTESN